MKTTMRNKSLIWLCSLVLLATQLSAQSTPPKLLYPSNGQVLKEAYPAFSWVKSMARNINFLYDIKVVEVLEGQTPARAILSNPALFIQQNVRNNLMMYPVTAPLFQAGKKYAWQVIGSYQSGSNAGARVTHGAKENTISLKLPSEVFWFQIESSFVKQVCVALSETAQKETYVIADFVLRFKFDEANRSIGQQLDYTITDEQGNPISSKRITPELVGDYYQIPLRQFKELRKKSNRGKFFFLKGASEDEANAYVVKFTYL
ncbi:MAG: hypothetical protein ACPGJS_05865 [Flammeovirgaceae bacterium]